MSAEDSARGPTTFELFLQATSSTKQGYNLLAPRFDATPYATPSNFISRALRRAQLRFPSNEDSTGLRAADLACGTGRATQMLASSFARVDAYDFSVGMLDRARELTQAQPNTSGRCDFIVADLANVSLPLEAYQRVVTFGAWGHILPRWRQHLAFQIVDSLRSGGVFLTITADPSVVGTRRWLYSAVFDSAMHLRNLVLTEPFHMYYRINDTLTVKQLFEHDPRVEIVLEPVPGSPHPELTLLMVRKLPQHHLR